jgi:hypothetical protein
MLLTNTKNSNSTYLFAFVDGKIGEKKSGMNGLPGSFFVIVVLSGILDAYAYYLY